MGLVGEGDHVGGQKGGQGQAEQERLGDGHVLVRCLHFTVSYK